MYINLMIVQNKNNYICYWLLLITSLIALMIVVGGITRLTGSGLSITRWDLFTGIFPPITLEKWTEAFLLYQQIPEFKIINSSMTLNEFKFIYFWEYIHRLLGRVIGLFYILPLIFFTYKKSIEKKNLLFLYSIFFLICFQGFIGWYMVQSGLVERVDVSHYRLSLHLTVAFLIYVLLFYKYLDFKYNQTNLSKKNSIFYFSLIFLIMVIAQISMGALVSGLDAGKIYTTWPLMNDNYYPDDINYREILSLKVFELPSGVQFLHRNIAYLIFLIFSLFTYLIFKSKNFLYLKKITYLIFIILIIQILLGIFTILSGAHIVLASLHQIGSIFLITTSIFLLYRSLKIN